VAELFWRLIAWIVTIPRVTDWLIRRAQRTPYALICGDDGSVYMDRWWLFNPYPHGTDGTASLRRFPWCPISIRVHHIHRPGHGRELHDHPWNARTIILRGGYAEVRDRWAVRLRSRGDTAGLKFGEFHRITTVAPGGAVTLFITGKYRGTWGFLVNGAKVPWREHLKVNP
jgi:hypothetical protein